MNRIDRLSAILIQLQTKQFIAAREIAERFAISLRTVYRDIKALLEAGVPVGAEAGKGYFLVAGYHIPPVMFSKEEAGAVLIAEKLVEKLTDGSIKQQFYSATSKIKAVLPDREKEFVNNLNSQVEVLYNPVSERIGFPNNYITEIQIALATKKCIKLNYHSFYAQEETIGRIVDPLGLVFYSNTWHLIGYCKLRNDMRDFRIDRISHLQITGEETRQKKNDELKKYFEKIWHESDLKEVTVWFDNSVASGLGSVKYYFGYIDECARDGGVEMDFAVNDYNYIARWLLSFGDKIKIVQPKMLNRIIVNLVKDLSRVYLHK